MNTAIQTSDLAVVIADQFARIEALRQSIAVARQEVSRLKKGRTSPKNKTPRRSSRHVASPTQKPLRTKAFCSVLRVPTPTPAPQTPALETRTTASSVVCSPANSSLPVPMPFGTPAIIMNSPEARNINISGTPPFPLQYSRAGPAELPSLAMLDPTPQQKPAMAQGMQVAASAAAMQFTSPAHAAAAARAAMDFQRHLQMLAYQQMIGAPPMPLSPQPTSPRFESSLPQSPVGVLPPMMSSPGPDRYHAERVPFGFQPYSTPACRPSAVTLPPLQPMCVENAQQAQPQQFMQFPVQRRSFSIQNLLL